MQEIKSIYNKLLKEYGRQGWWPLTPEYSFKTKHHVGKPKNSKHRFEIILGAILTQNTSWKNVEKAISQLNREKLVNINKISKTNHEKLANLIKSAGYYNQKAERLKIIADYIVKNYDGDIDGFFNKTFFNDDGSVKLKKIKESKFSKMNKSDELKTSDTILEHKNNRVYKNKGIGELRKELLEINGIGPETADSIILYAAEKPSFVVDAYTRRIFSRLGLIDENAAYDEIQEFFMKTLPKNTELFKEYHALIVEHAKRHCKNKPICNNCPVIEFCKYR